MLNELSTVQTGDQVSEQTSTEAEDQLWSIAYHSRPTQPLSGSRLKDLLLQAQNNNSARGISGLLVVGNNEFVQWLEGPETALRALMQKISTDARHADVAILETAPVAKRLFGEWSMLFADEIQHAHVSLPPMLAMPSNLINELKFGSGRIDEAFGEIAFMASGAGGTSEPPEITRGRSQAEEVSLGNTRLIEGMLTRRIIPEMLERAGRSNALEPTLLITALAQVALDQDAKTIRSILERTSLHTTSPIGAQISLLEQTERYLGDMWQDDRCSGEDIVLALLELVKALRVINERSAPTEVKGAAPPAVLVISQPGEQHMLPAVLDAELLYQHGWQPTLEFPASDSILSQRVSDDWFDAVDISLSDVFRREHSIDQVARTISSVRESSRNKQIAVTVGGRMFREDVGLLMNTGADRLVVSANDIEWAIADALRLRKRAAF